MTAIAIVAGISVTALVMIWLAMFIDICVTKSDVWYAAGQDRWFCLLMLIGLGPLGAIVYGVGIRPQLARMEMKVAVTRAKPAGRWTDPTLQSQ